MSAPIRTLIVDDSAFVRKVVREMLSRDADIEVVGAARDGEEAIERISELNPDVVTCDLTMPRLDGVAFVKRQMALRPVPILLLSASPQDAEEVIQALDAGAFDFVRKPTALATDALLDIREELCSKVRAAAQVPVGNLILRRKIVHESFQPHSLRVDAVVIGISTGGPQALRQLLPQLPANFPVPLAIVLHMPVGYTALFSEKLDELCAVKVSEAREGERLAAGHAYIAQAGRHLVFHRESSGAVSMRLSMQPIDLVHRPSVDVLFQSAAEVFKERLLAVVMTGMGDDGKQGSAWVKAQGGTVLTEAEKSCVIYGMPRSVVEAGLSDAAVPLDSIAQEILKRL